MEKVKAYKLTMKKEKVVDILDLLNDCHMDMREVSVFPYSIDMWLVEIYTPKRKWDYFLSKLLTSSLGKEVARHA